MESAFGSGRKGSGSEAGNGAFSSLINKITAVYKLFVHVKSSAVLRPTSAELSVGSSVDLVI